MLSERIAPLAVGSGLICMVLSLIVILFRTDFPTTAWIKSQRCYGMLAGAYCTVGVALAAFFAVAFVIVVFNVH